MLIKIRCSSCSSFPAPQKEDAREHRAGCQACLANSRRMSDVSKIHGQKETTADQFFVGLHHVASAFPI